MKFYNASEFRRHMATCLSEATKETVYILRPGGHLIQLSSVPNQDAATILAMKELLNKQK